MMSVGFPKILRLAQQLPPETQLVLADTLLHAYTGNQALVRKNRQGPIAAFFYKLNQAFFQ
jgi:hypothetical protein